MRPSARKQLLVILIVQCSWFLARIESGRVGHAMTEDEKQSAFEQLLGKASRLRMAGSSQTLFEATTIQPPTIATMSTAMPIMLSDEEAKRHDRRHAVHQPKKHNKKDHSKRQHHAGRHVCTHEETITRPIRVVESYCKPAYKSFTQRCSNGTMCTAFRVQYDTIYRTVVKYQTTTEKKHACCPGWTHTEKHTHGCLQAVCSKGCKNGGTCVKPNTCNCAPGYTGPSCESDLDECAAPSSNLCQQTCINSAGSYQCACHDGFQLQDDGRSCKFRLELVPELKTLLINYESMSKRLAALEQEPRVNSSPSQPHPAPQVDVIDYQSTIANMTDHIILLEEKLNKLQNETTILIANSNNTVESSNNESLESLSEQVAILEERLADCTCTMAPIDNTVKTRL
ncbi:epidermal growth factor-like protein 7 isoform X2 [Daphnia pulicaria]|uniref:epidermal growth factor-like protein 7 isoform X2 n=1 Tax=Daphnia pulicaria TaxID=35523 RepID=UPI001EECC9F2|nr:epidermal growth factor-like protein 7 isoform X2 [Daphnia pulicaria]